MTAAAAAVRPKRPTSHSVTSRSYSPTRVPTTSNRFGNCFETSNLTPAFQALTPSCASLTAEPPRAQGSVTVLTPACRVSAAVCPTSHVTDFLFHSLFSTCQAHPMQTDWPNAAVSPKTKRDVAWPRGFQGQSMAHASTESAGPGPWTRPPPPLPHNSLFTVMGMAECAASPAPAWEGHPRTEAARVSRGIAVPPSPTLNILSPGGLRQTM